jgi:hypothetical protein
MTPRRKRLIFGIVFVSAWAGMLIPAAVTTGPDRRSAFADHPVTHVVWAVLIIVLGGYLLADPGHWIRAYSSGINWGPFKMSDTAVFRLVLFTGVFLMVAGMAVGVLAVLR